MTTRPPVSTLALPLVCGTALTLAAVSCTRTPREPEPATARDGAAAAFRADTRAMNAPAPPGLDPALAQPVAPDDLKARMTLDEALAALTAPAAEAPASPVDPAAAPRAESPDPARQSEALRLYAQGRVARLTNQTREAVTALQSAARLDPTSAEIWRELGDAQLSSGNRVFAAAAFNRALAVEPADPRSLEQSSAIAVERRDYASAANLSARLLATGPERLDPALPFITWSRLARSAAALGYTRASAEAALRAVDLPERFNAPTTRENDLNALYRTRGDTIRDAADAMLRLGRFEDARAAYERAAALPTLAPSALTPRRVHAAMRLGDSAGERGAAAIVLEQLRAARGRPDDTLLALISHVAEHTSAGAPALLKGIDAVESGLTESERRLAAGALVRARAAASPRSAAVALLRARLAQAPADDDAMRVLLARLRADPESAVVRECVALIEAAPLQERRHGIALARELAARRARDARASTPAAPQPSSSAPETSQPEQPPRLADALDDAAITTGGGPAAALLRARLLAAENLNTEALGVLDTVTEGGAFGTAATLARVGLLQTLGRIEEADTLLRNLPAEDDAARAAKGLALVQRGEDELALETLAPLLDPPDSSGPAPSPVPGVDRAELLVAAGQVLARRGEAEPARARFEAAIAADPLRDDAYVGLIALHAPNQPLADESRLVDTIRRLREANPSSRSLRWLRAQESLARGQLDLAERDLADLAEESPTQPEVINALTQLWIRTGSGVKAETWLRAKSERFPDSSALAVALARTVTAQGRFSEAETLLQRRLELTPGDADVSRALESLYRDELKQPEKADELARKRLQSAPPTPDTLLEQADLAWRASRFAEASKHLAGLLDRFPRVTFRPDQAARISEFIVVAGTNALRENQFTREFVGVVNRLVDAAPSVAAEAHALRLMLANRSGFTEAPELVSALERAVKQWPRRAEELVARAADAAWNRERTQRDVELPQADADLVAAARRRSLQIIESGSRLLTRVSPVIVLDWMDLALVTRQGKSFVAAIDRARADGVLDAVLENMLGGINPRAARDRALADNAYQLASLLSFLGEDAASEEMLRTALRHDPRHHPSANDLGYRLLVADREIDEAARLIEIALRQQPDRASYVDSMGWARYKQGQMSDEVDPATNQPRPGALSLLTRALDLMANDPGDEARHSTPIIIDHLGDASWAAGDHETAVRHWELAAQDSAALLEEDDENGKSNDPQQRERRLGAALRAELETVLNATRTKANAAREGRPPPIARIHGPVR